MDASGMLFRTYIVHMLCAAEWTEFPVKSSLSEETRTVLAIMKGSTDELYVVLDHSSLVSHSRGGVVCVDKDMLA
jgi:hypothetical protein